MMTLIQEIHNEFSTSEAKLLKEVKDHLGFAEEVNKEEIEKLKALGFSNFKELRDLDKSKIEKSQGLQNLVESYRLLSPFYKFITEDKVVELCKKYGLIHTTLDKYTDSIPEKNRQEILSFDSWASKTKIPSEKTFKFEAAFLNGKFLQDTETNEIINLFQEFKRIQAKIRVTSYGYKDEIGPIRDYATKNRESVAYLIKELIIRGEVTLEDLMNNKINNYHNFYPLSDLLNSHIIIFREGFDYLIENLLETQNYTIIAAQKMIDITGMTLNKSLVSCAVKELILDKYSRQQKKTEETKIELLQDDDPIVLKRVKGGYLIVTAWGEEASDPNVVNNNLN